MNKLLRITLLAVAMLVGSVVAFADCPGSVNVTSGDYIYSCALTKQDPDGSCHYGNCQRVGKVNPGPEEEMLAY
jgi:hypothetical protein